MTSSVTKIPPADSATAHSHFSRAFQFETDCWDVHEAMSNQPDFVLVDVRSPASYAKGHIRGATNIPHAKLIEATLRQYPKHTVFVVYCAGPHCNGAHHGAVRLAQLGRPVKMMIGGITGWLDEGFTLESSAE